jgi:TolB-like protein/DNA-binding winged helix-turn-helix (wHTH) protein
MQPDGRRELIRFGPFELKLRSEELCRDGVAVKLPPQPFKVLVLLAQNAGQLVTREEIQSEIWGDGTFVDFDKGLNFCIKQIREALGDNAQSPRYIETLPRRGYRFIAAIDDNGASLESAGNRLEDSLTERVESEAPSPEKSLRGFRWQAVAVVAVLLLPLIIYLVWHRLAAQTNPPAGKIMLAVLPFENLNADSNEDYFSDGLTEEMITQLGRLQPARLGVIARTTALTYKKTGKDIRQIGRELGVSYVLEGSVRREADRVRITAQLIQVEDQTHLWAETYERNERDVLQLQSEVASHVARSLAIELLPAPRPDSIRARTSQPEAYDAYLKGRYLITKDTLPDLERSLPYFEQAIEKDPAFAPAYVAFVEARVLWTTWVNNPAGEALPKTRDYALKAVELDPTFAEAYAALGSVNFWLEWNWPEAEANIKQAIRLNPSNPNTHILYANFLLARGQDEAYANEVKVAVQLDPVSLLTNGLSAYIYLRARMYDDAIIQGNRMLELEPKSPAAHECLTRAYIHKGMYKEAIDIIRRYRTLTGAKQQDIDALNGDAKEVISRTLRPDIKGMETALAKGEKIPALYVAATYINAGEKDRAFEWLEKSFVASEPHLIFLRTDPRYDAIHADPRFDELSRRIGLIE